MKFFSLLLVLILTVFDPGLAKGKCISPGDFFDGNGSYLGSDGVDDGRVFIANRRKSKHVRQALEQGDMITAQNLSTEIPGLITLSESLDVLERTESNGGFQEEVSLVLKNGTIVKGKPGPVPSFENGRLHAEFIVPNVPKGFTDRDVATLIHSHPTSDTAQGRGYYRFSALFPSEADQIIFRRFQTNIIAGLLRLESFDNSLHDEKEKSLGIAVYNQNTELIISLEIDAVKDIVEQLRRD